MDAVAEDDRRGEYATQSEAIGELADDDGADQRAGALGGIERAGLQQGKMQAFPQEGA